MARGKDIAGLAALGALGMMLSGKGGSEGKPSATSDDQYNPDVKYAGLMEQKEPGWESGTSTKPSSAGGSKPSSKRSEIVNPELTRTAGQGGPRGTRYNEADASQTRIAGQGGPRGTRYNEDVAPQRSLNSAEALAQLDQQTGVRAMDPNSSRGPNAADSTELGRNISAIANGTGPGKLVTGLSLAAREAKAADLAQKAYNQRAALRRSEEGLNAEEAARAAVSARDAKTLNPMAWMAGPKGMKEDFKRGGKVKKMASGGKVKVSASSRGDGIAMRGKTRGKLC
jgi:hypothetical protein